MDPQARSRRSDRDDAPDHASERSSADPLLADLTPSQRAAVTHARGPLLVLAGPGSGKTRVITRRIAYLLREGVAPWRVLALTFTNKAAGEMRHRVSELLGGADSPARRGLTVTTFHALCVRLLRRYAEPSGLTAAGLLPAHFTVYDADDQARLMKRILADLQISGSNFPVRSMLAGISDAKNRLIDEERYAAEAGDFFARQLARVYRAYQRALRQAGAADFDDLLLLTERMLRQSEGVRAEIRRRFRYLLVDEYQDTNRAQFEIARLIAGGPDEPVPRDPDDPFDSAPTDDAVPGPNICVVGDPDQSIYGWRGADLSNILQFERHYPGCRTIALGENFRSREPILAAADRLIRRNRLRRHKPLVSTRRGGAVVECVLCRDEHHEARLVLEWIERLVHDGAGPGTPALTYKDFAVLYRTNALSRVMEDTLRNAGVPYTIVRGTAFYDREEIRHALAYLRLLVNPADEVSLQRIVNVPARGISDATFERVSRAASDAGVPVFDLMRRPDALSILQPRARRAVEQFVAMVDRWRAWLEAPRAEEDEGALDLRGLVERVLTESGLVEVYRRAQDTERLENLDELISSVAEFQEDAAGGGLIQEPPVEPGGPGEDPFGPVPDGPVGAGGPSLGDLLAAYLERVALVADTDAIDPSRGAVTLMTLHAAKGLEYRAVAVIGLEEGMLPHIRAVHAIDGSDAAMEEERRLTFVGITRAMDRLLLTSSNFRSVRGVAERCIPSRFLGELEGPGVEFIDRSGRRFERGDGPSVEEGGGVDDWDVDQRVHERAGPRRSGTGSARLSAGGAGQGAGGGTAFSAGARVRHPQFGVGEVLSYTGGAHARVTVRFRDVGVKTLIVEYARLTRL